MSGIVCQMHILDHLHALEPVHLHPDLMPNGRFQSMHKPPWLSKPGYDLGCS